jgi:hypothetical protein
VNEVQRDPKRFSLVFVALVPLLSTACTSLVGVPYASSLEEGGVDGAAGVDQTSPPVGDATDGTDSSTLLTDSSSLSSLVEATTDTSEPVDSPVVIDTGPPLPPPTKCAVGATIVAMATTGPAVLFNTTGAVCITYRGSVNGWNASNVNGRSVTVVGSTTQMPLVVDDSIANQPGLLPGTDGYIYWNFTTGTASYASLSAF